MEVEELIMKNNQKLRKYLFNKKSFNSLLTRFPTRIGLRLPLWRFGTKIKIALTVAIVTILLVSAFVFLAGGKQGESNFTPQNFNPTATPTPEANSTLRPSSTNTPDHSIGSIIRNIIPSYPSNVRKVGLIESSPVITNVTWRSIAANAWQYFQPDIGVDSTTGLPGAGLGFPYFTDWDLGVYIQACIDAQKIGLVNASGDWGSNVRLEKVLTFLETRELNSTTHYPFWFYQAGNGKNMREMSDTSKVTVDAVDTGRLFVALNNLKAYSKEYNPTWVSRIDNFVHNRFGNRSNYAVVVPDVINDCLTSTSIYTYYVASGYAAFWPQVNASKVLDNMMKAGTVPTNGVILPRATISCEPLLCAMFELSPNPQLTSLTRQVYNAHEAYYRATDSFVAFSEGNSDRGFIYEWVVLPNNVTWAVTTIDMKPLNMNPIIFNKVAYGFLALYNTTYARDTALYLEMSFANPAKGYPDGADFAFEPLNREYAPQIGTNTNGLILGAARYALK